MVSALLILAAITAAPVASAEPGIIGYQECTATGHWSGFANRALTCYDECVGSGHWTTFPDRLIACAL